MFTSHILHFFQKSEFPFGIISLHPEEPIEQVLWWQILSFVFSKCLYYTPVVYRDLVCQRFRQFICRLGTPLLWLFIPASPLIFCLLWSPLCVLWMPQPTDLQFSFWISTIQLASTQREQEAHSEEARLLSIFFPTVSACFWLLCSVFRWMFLIYCPESIILTCQSIGQTQAPLPLAEVELFLFVLIWVIWD